MAYTTIVTGTTITSSWANASVRDQVVSPFASTAARSSAITAPVNGMISTQSSADSSCGIYHYNGTSWRQPWNLPWGYLGTAYSPANITFDENVGQTATFSPTLVNNRYYQAFVKCEVQNGAVTGIVDTISFYDSTGAASVGDLRVYTPGGANFQDAFVSSIIFDSPGTGTNAYRVRAIASVASAVQTLANITVWFVDVGPSGAPV